MKIGEFAKAIGISTTYIEPIVNKLVNGELMKCVGDKVYTDFIIFTEKDRTANLQLEAILAEQLYKEIWETIQLGLDQLHQQDFYKALTPSQAINLDSFFIIRTVQNATNNIRNEACGGAPKFEDYPDRQNGGKWYAMGNQYPTEYDWNASIYHKYYISGESEITLGDYQGLKWIKMLEYDCAVGRAYQLYCGDEIPYKMSGSEVMKMLYAIHTGQEDMLALIHNRCLENVEYFKKVGYLSSDENGKVICDIPVIKMNDRWRIYELSEKYDNLISEKFHDELTGLMINPVKLPPHLKSVPNWQRYMYCCSTFPMRVIMNAHDNGLFFTDKILRKILFLRCLWRWRTSQGNIRERI